VSSSWQSNVPSSREMSRIFDIPRPNVMTFLSLLNQNMPQYDDWRYG
jgi:hypothetical protein